MSETERGILGYTSDAGTYCLDCFDPAKCGCETDRNYVCAKGCGGIAPVFSAKGITCADCGDSLN